MTIKPDHAILIAFLDGDVPLWEIGWMGSSLGVGPEETRALLTSLLRSGLVELRASKLNDFSGESTPTEEAIEIVSDPQAWLPPTKTDRLVNYWVDVTDEGLKQARVHASELPEGHKLPWEERPIP